MNPRLRPILIAGMAVLLGVPAAWADTAPDRWTQAVTQNLQPLKGDRYTSPFGYSVAVPPGAAAWVALSINPDRGTLIILGPHRSIDVFGGPDARRYHNTHEYLLALIHDQPAGHISLSQTKLAGEPAEQALVDYNDVRRHIVAQRIGPRATAKDYSLVLTTDTAHQAQDEASLAVVLKSYRRETAQK